MALDWFVQAKCHVNASKVAWVNIIRIVHTYSARNSTLVTYQPTKTTFAICGDLRAPRLLLAFLLASCTRKAESLNLRSLLRLAQISLRQHACMF